MPARVSELMEKLVKNEPGGRLRFIVIGFEGEVIIDLTYHQSEWASKKQRNNLHVLHPTVGKVFTCYRLNIRLLTDTAFRIVHGVWHNYVFCSPSDKADRGTEKWDSNVVSRELWSLSRSKKRKVPLVEVVWKPTKEPLYHIDHETQRHILEKALARKEAARASAGRSIDYRVNQKREGGRSEAAQKRNEVVHEEEQRNHTEWGFCHDALGSGSEWHIEVGSLPNHHIFLLLASALVRLTYFAMGQVKEQ
ncbi:hypothetical protein V8E36_007525 [Tilletia maclaganii]